jgi:hypothetical protein
MKRILILILVTSTLAAARDKKAKARPGPYVFTSRSSAQTLKALIVQANLREGYTLDSDNPAPVSLLETSADARRGCDFHGLKHV